MREPQKPNPVDLLQERQRAARLSTNQSGLREMFRASLACCQGCVLLHA